MKAIGMIIMATFAYLLLSFILLFPAIWYWDFWELKREKADYKRFIKKQLRTFKRRTY